MARISLVQLDFLHPAGRGSRAARILLLLGVLTVTAKVAFQQQITSGGSRETFRLKYMDQVRLVVIHCREQLQ